MECPRCFYLDNKLGTKRPGFPAFNLNLAVDELFKKEFDSFRASKTRHPLMENYQIDAIPFSHADLDIWRDPFQGVEHLDQTTKLLVSGGIDDVWLHQDRSLIMVDYKATAKSTSITTLSDSPWDQQYQRQLSVYSWLFKKNGFKVAKRGYLVYANANSSHAGFENLLHFETTLVPVDLQTDWIEPTLHKIKLCLEETHLPPVGDCCEYCPYREAAGKKLQTIHKKLHAKI